MPNEKGAYEVEAAVIDALRLLDDDGDNPLLNVTNLVLGHHHLERGLAPDLLRELVLNPNKRYQPIN